MPAFPLLKSIGLIVTAKIADLAVTTAKIANLAVTTGKIAAGAVTAAKVAADVATQAELDAHAAADKSTAHPGTVEADDIADGAVTAAKVAADVATQAELGAHAAADKSDAHPGTVEAADIAALAVETAKINDLAVTTAKIATEIVAGWMDANESWAYASATTITVPAGAASKYQVGDKIKLTQTTVKYFRVTGVADTLLTVWGLGLYTVADAAISANFYSKAANPQGWVFNNYPSFSTYRLGALGLPAGAITVIPFDTEEYDYGGVHNVATGVFTAPLGGQYHFDAAVYCTNVASNEVANIHFYVNGASVKQGNEVSGSSVSAADIQLSADLLLNSGDAVAVRVYVSNTAANIYANRTATWWMGHLVG